METKTPVENTSIPSMYDEILTVGFLEFRIHAKSSTNIILDFTDSPTINLLILELAKMMSVYQNTKIYVNMNYFKFYWYKFKYRMKGCQKYSKLSPVLGYKDSTTNISHEIIFKYNTIKQDKGLEDITVKTLEDIFNKYYKK